MVFLLLQNYDDQLCTNIFQERLQSIFMSSYLMEKYYSEITNEVCYENVKNGLRNLIY